MLSLDNMYSGREHPGMANMPPSAAYNPAGYGMQAYGMPPAYYGNPEQNMYHGEHNGNGVQVTGVERIDLENPVTPPPQRERFSYTRYQLELLNGIYQQIRYPNSMQKQLVAKRVGITRDQVKIWFQNRRRKDITGKGSKNKAKRDEYEDDNKNPMVPESIMKSVIQELLKYENDPKGKKLRAKMQEKKKTPYDRPSRVKQESPIPSPPEIGVSHLDPNENYSPLQGFNAEAPPNANIANTSVGSTATLSPHSLTSSTDSHSPGSYTEQQRVSPQQESDKKSVGVVPSNEQLDMPAPPNAVAPPSGELDDKLSATFNPAPVPNNHTPQGSGVRSNPTSPDQNSQDGHLHGNKNAPYQWQQGDYPEGFFQDFAMAALKEQMNANGMPVSTQPSNGLPFSYGQSSTANTAVTTSDANMAKSQLSPEQQKAMERVFPFPLVADQPMMLSALPPYPDPYAAAAKGPAPSGVYRDPYQPIMISSFNNPYYGYDNAQVSAFQNGQKYSNL